jgi:hypothetical protein
MILGVHSDTSFSAFSAVRAPILPEKKWENRNNFFHPERVSY